MQQKTKLFLGGGLAIGILCIFCYGDIVDHPWSYDDLHYVKSAQQGHIFLSDYVSRRPITHCWFWVMYQWAEMEATNYHLANTILHGLVCFLLVWVVWKRTSNLVATMTPAVLFCVSPVHFEAVYWISGVSYTLCGLFVLLALWSAYEKKYISSIFIILGSLSHPVGVLVTPMALMIWKDKVRGWHWLAWAFVMCVPFLFRPDFFSRYLYLPSIGIVIFLSYFAVHRPKISIVAVATIVALCLPRFHGQAGEYLWASGNFYLTHQDDPNMAIQIYHRAILEYGVSGANVRHNLSVAYLQVGLFERAKQMATENAEIYPDYVPTQKLLRHLSRNVKSGMDNRE